MCGRYLIDDEAFDLSEIIAAAEKNTRANPEWSAFSGGEIFPGSIAPVIAAENDARFMFWGFPSLIAGKQPHINARSESAAEKKTFSNAMASRRCLIPASGYYEWKKIDKNRKEKYEFTLPDRMTMYMAGIYSEEEKFAILTRAATPSVADIYDRMPVIFTKPLGDAWVNESTEVIYQALTDLKSRHIPGKNDRSLQMSLF